MTPKYLELTQHMNPYRYVDQFDPNDVTAMIRYTGGREADKIISPDGNPYIFRWELAKTPRGGAYFHVQVASDADRGLHDHPWDNCSVILAGAYEEIYTDYPEEAVIAPKRRVLVAGDMMHRPYQQAHRLILPKGVPYCMTLFSMGPLKHSWGFWYDDGQEAKRRFVPFEEATTWDPETKQSIHKELVDGPNKS